MSTGRAVGWVLAVLVAGAGCVAPAPDTAAYESKAASAAAAALSAARTAVLATDTHADGRLPSTYLEPVLIDAEQTLGSVRTAFDSVQPPATDAADALRAELDPMLEAAGGALTDLRIAVRRGRPDDLMAAAGDLTGVADRLDAFDQEHR